MADTGVKGGQWLVMKPGVQGCHGGNRVMPSLRRSSSCSTRKRSGLGWGQRPESPQSPTTTYQSHSDKEDQGLAGSLPEYGKPGGLLGWGSRGEGDGTHYLFIYLCTHYLFIFHGRELEMKSNYKDRERMADACASYNYFSLFVNLMFR